MAKTEYSHDLTPLDAALADLILERRVSHSDHQADRVFQNPVTAVHITRNKPRSVSF